MWRVVVIAIATWLVLAPAAFIPYAIAIGLRERDARRRGAAGKAKAHRTAELIERVAQEAAGLTRIDPPRQATSPEAAETALAGGGP